ncbi:MAG: peptidoglycan synthetase FtsI, partial [Actinomycetota bacterium]
RPAVSLKRSSSDVDQSMRRRLFGIGVLIVCLLGVLVFRVTQLQTWGRSAYLAESIDQRTRVNTIRASRGVIFDRNGNEIALSVPTTTIWADPRAIIDPVATSHALATIIGLDAAGEADLLAKLSVNTNKFAYVAREMQKENAQAVLDLGLPGIYSYVEPARVIESGVAEAVIGRTDPDGLGTSGLELQYNDTLTGVDGTQVRQVDNNGRSIPGTANNTVQPMPGDDIVSTLDKTIQYQMDAAVLSRVKLLSAKGGTAIAIDSRTGDVLAMTNVKRRSDGTVAVAQGNFAAVEAYEPGSVAKVFSISAALNEGLVTPETVLTVPGIVNIDNFPIRDAWPHGPLDMSVRTILAESSNIGTMMVAEKVEFNRLHDYLSAFGFGKHTGLNYPGESRGILKSVKKTYGTERSTVSYGYGFAASPLQMISAANVVANGGTYVAPRLVSATIDKNGKRHEAEASATRPVLKPETAATMTDLMRDVVCYGTGERAKVKGMEIAGKTGTGYKLQANGTYNTDAGGRRYFASFVGFFPASAPRVTMLVSIDEPSSSSIDRFGGTAAAPVFAQLVPTVMHELGIEPTGTDSGCHGRVAPNVGH